MVTKPGQIPGEQTSNGGSEQRLRDVNEKVVPSSAPERELIEKLEIAEKKLSFLGLVVASSAESIVTVDFGGVITTWNKSAERLYGYPADEAVGKPLTMLTLPEDLLEILSNIDSIKHGEAVEIYDTVRIRKSGDHIDLEILMSPVTSADGHIIGVATIARDITERVRAESERENSRIAEKEQKASELAAVRLSETQLAESQTRLALELAAVQHLQEEQTRAQEMLRLSEGQLQALLDQTPMGVYLVDADFRIVAVNPTAMPVFAGIPDLIGRDFDEVIHRLWSEEYADEVVRLFRHTLETGEPYYTPERIEERRDLGVAEYYEWQISRIPLPDARDGVVCYFRDVSAQVFARLNLAASEEKYRTLFESIDEGFCLIDLLFDEAGEAYDYVFLEANAAFERQSGLVGVVGRSILELVPGFDAQWVKLYGLVAKTGESRRFEADVASMARVYDVYAFSSGENKVAAVFNDITERKRSEANLAFLAEVSNDLVRFTTIDETINALGAKIARHFRASLCSFLDIDAERGIGTILHEWRAEDAISLIGEYRIADYGSEEQLATWRSGEPFVVRDVESDERVNAEALAPFGIGSYLSIPIARDGEWRYLLTVYDRAARDWREDEVHLMSELTSRIWTRLERARAEAALLVREARQAFLLKLSDALRPIADPLEIQAVAMRVLGEYLGNIGAQYYESDDDGEHFNSFGGYTDGSVAIVERVRLDDFGAFTKEAYRAGRTLVVNDVPHDDRITPEQADAYKAIGVYAYVGVPLIKAGRLVVALGAVTSAAHAWTKDEIALIEETAQRTWAAVERARAEAALLESETRYRALVTVGSSTIYRMSPDWREMFQLDGAGFVADTEGPTTDWIETYLPPDERPRVEEAIARAIRTKDVFELEHRVKRVDGTVGWTLSRAIPLLDDAGEIKEWFGVASDVTARVKADQSFTRLFEASPAPFLVLAPDAPRFTITEVNDAYLTATMRTREELVGRPLFDAFPDNPNEPAINGVSTLRASLEDVLASHRPNALPSLKFDIARPDGTFEERWWSPVNSPILDEN
ncbi:MAG TPA: PAS domain S-box protein, partial [Pyrinomonadaceae bacterium]|nr:PAS domain S-box protein [Pyrinomonadaceae bacterium]